MGLFSFIKEVGGVVSQQMNSNNMMEKYVGELPSSYPKEIYQNILATAQGFQQRLGGAPLNVAELSMLRLALFAQLAHDKGDFDLRRKYIDAAERVGSDYINTIRMEVQDACFYACPLMRSPGD